MTTQTTDLPSAKDRDAIAAEDHIKAITGPFPTLQKEDRRPTPATIDILVAEYETAEACLDAAQKTFDAHQVKLLNLVQAYGAVPAGAEKSRRLEGQRTVLTVTTGSSLTLKQDAVVTLRDALNVNGQGALFFVLFREEKKFELLKGAETELRTANLPQRLADRVMRMFAGCFDIKVKSPSLKVKRLADNPPAKKSRARKQAA
jgi:hypothetical protein